MSQGGAGAAPEAGTSLAIDACVAAAHEARPSSPDALWRYQRDQHFVAETRETSLFVIGAGVFVHAAVLAALWYGGYPAWRVATLGGLYAVFMISHRLILRTTRKEPARVATAFMLMSITAQLFVIGSATLTGGIHSPFVPSSVLPSIVGLLFFGPQPVARWMAVANACLIIAMVVLPPELVGPAPAPAYYAFAVVVGLSWTLFMLHLLVGKLSVIASRTGESMASLREERLADAEARLRRLQSVGAKVAHELKNPLASIKGLCQLVARTPESERTQERLAVVASEIARMEAILAEYLSFSRPLEDLRPEAIDLAELARDVLDVLDGRAVNAGVALSVDGEAPAVAGDPRRLKEALINLVANAIEATPSGGRVALRLRTPTTGGVVLEVSDTGRGIAPDDLERLGTSFFTTRANGTGLGVVLAQGVIAQHGGSLSYASTVGKGTTATITLPGRLAEATAVAAAASAAARGAA